MKRMLLLCFMLMAVLAVNAQRNYVVTGNNVNLRTGPGQNYGNVYTQFGDRIQLFKGSIVKSLGQKKNGFCKVEIFFRQDGSYSGWVSARYLKSVRICSRCDGNGAIGYGVNVTTCPRCGGRGY